MKKVSLAACAIAATLCTAPLALAAPNSLDRIGRSFKQLKTTSDDQNVSIFGDLADFEATWYLDQSGVPQGFVKIISKDYPQKGIGCEGPAYGQPGSIDPTNGNTIIKVTLDPANPACAASNWDAGPVTVNLVGKYSGGYRSSSQGTVIGYVAPTPDATGGTYKTNTRTSQFELTFSGAVPGFTLAPTGGATRTQSITRQKVK
jgi:hypothetical protein